jgi:GT2 family glycosyltransferase
MRYSPLPDENSSFWLQAPRRVSSLTGAALLVPRAVFESLNGFDTMLGHYLQDVDFCMRASGMGVPVVFDPRSILIHFESLSVKQTLSDERVTYTREKEFEYFRRRWPILHDKWLNPRLSPDDEAMRSFVSL